MNWNLETFDVSKLKRLLLFIIAGIFMLSFFLGYSCREFLQMNNSSTQKAQTLSEKEGKKKRLTEAMIQQFLMDYYTKKELGENRERYKRYMTNSLFEKQTKLEDLPVNQTYKGYIVQQVYDKSNIYINNKDLTAITEVDFHNKQLKEKNNFEKDVQTVQVTDTLLLRYIEEEGKLVLDDLSRLSLTKEPLNEGENNDFENTTEMLRGE